MDENMQAFLKALDPMDNSAGGGTASAVAGAMAASLAAMVARLSLGKKEMEPDAFYLQRGAALESLSKELFTGGRQDSEAFASVRGAFRLPKITKEEKTVRRQAIQAAWVQAAEVPLANAERCVQVQTLVRELEGRSNENAASDLTCAYYLTRAGALGCLENVAINLPMIRDQAIVDQLSAQAAKLKEAI